MIGIGLGLLLIAGVLAIGALLVADGLVRRAIRRPTASRQALRTARLTAAALLAMAGLAIGLPLAAGPANLVRVEGMPFGYYLAAQGALIGLVILAFVWAARQNRIDAGEPDA